VLAVLPAVPLLLLMILLARLLNFFMGGGAASESAAVLVDPELDSAESCAIASDSERCRSSRIHWNQQT